MNDNNLSQEYNDGFTQALEMIYGDSTLSQGGDQVIDNIFSKIPISNKRILDFGCGLGGTAKYLANKYLVHISAVDCVSRLIDEAKNRLGDSLVG